MAFHHVFKVVFNGGVSRVLKTPGIIINSITNSAIRAEHMIWDTGATNTCISPEIANKLGLTPIGMTTAYTANGPNQVNIYLVDVKISDQVGIKNVRVSEANLGPNTDVLIGMDIIGIGDFTVQNCGGNTEFSFCIPPFETKYDMIEKAEKVNKRNHKSKK